MIYLQSLNRQMLEFQGRLENEGTKRITSQVLNITRKVSETVIHLKVDEEQWTATTRSKGQVSKNTPSLPVKVLHLSAP